MKRLISTILFSCAVSFLACCSSVNHEFPTASLGAGAKAGQDYVTNLIPSNAARQYFAGIPTTTPIETLTPANAAGSNSGVRFVANDGILIPAGVVIQFNNKGYCMDPKLPAPVGDDEYQFVPTTALIPSELQEMYSNLVRRAATGDSAVVSNMQRLIWALRTAGTDAIYANNLSSAQKQLLNSCAPRSGGFDNIHQRAKQQAELTNKLWNMADKAISFNLGNRTYRPSNFKNMGAINTVLNSELDNLVNLGKKLPIQRTGFNFGELQPGIYTDIRGTGTLSFRAKIANASKQDYIFYPCNYVGQVGSGSALTTFSFAAAANTTQRQRVTIGPIKEVEVIFKDKKKDDTVTRYDFHNLPLGERLKLIQMTALASASYSPGEQNLSNAIVKAIGCELKESWNNEGFTASLHVNKSQKTVYLTFRGTATGHDAIDDFKIFTSDKGETNLTRFNFATTVAQKAIKEHPGHSVVLVGHSLGGSVVQHVLDKLPESNLSGYTVNSYGLPGERGITVDSRLVNIVYENDPVQKVVADSRIVGSSLIQVHKSKPVAGETHPNKVIVNTAAMIAYPQLAIIGNLGLAMYDSHSVDSTLENMILQHSGARQPK